MRCCRSACTCGDHSELSAGLCVLFVHGMITNTEVHAFSPISVQHRPYCEQHRSRHTQYTRAREYMFCMQICHATIVQVCFIFVCSQGVAVFTLTSTHNQPTTHTSAHTCTYAPCAPPLCWLAAQRQCMQTPPPALTH